MKSATLSFLLGCAIVFAHAAPSQAQSAQTSPGEDAPQVIDVTAIDFAFRAPDVIRPGWTTLRFANEGEETHFVFLSRLPEGTTSDDYELDLSMKFNDVWYALRDSKVDQDGALAMLGEALPEWFASLQIAGGPGLLEPGLTSEITMNLEPGTYVIECYMKTEDGEIHFMEGMMRPLVVSGEPVNASPPPSDIRITLSNFALEVEGELKPGKRTVEVHVIENPEVGFGHSVHVARLDADTEIDAVASWMNWFGVDGLRTPAPARFIGGAHPMPEGSTAYFTVDVEPGRYLFISEATAHQGVLQEINIAQ